MWAGTLVQGDLHPATVERLAGWLGSGAEICQGPRYALGVRPGDLDDARLEQQGDGRILLSVDVNGERATVAILDPGPPHPLVTLIPDPFGLRGCFVRQVGGSCWFTSDTRVRDGAPDLRRPVDPVALHGYLCFSYVPTPRTLADDFLSVPAGGRWVTTAAGCRYEPDDPWREGEPTPLTEDEAAQELRRRLQDAVACRLGGADEVGVFLSGGLDSSLIAALLVEAGARVQLFTLDFGPPYDIELPFARQVAEHLKSPLHVVPARPREVRSALRVTASALQQPFGDGVTVPLYLLGKAASDLVGVVFNGEGGDQLFGGWANKPMVAAALYGGAGYDPVDAYLATFHRFYGQTDALYTKAARAETTRVDARAWLERSLPRSRFGSLLHWLRAANLRLKGAQNIAPRAVQLAEAHGLQMRAPFFDRALAEWTFTLPPEWLLRGAREKAILKQVAAGYLPPEIVEREKRGMGVPVTEWCLGELRRDVARVLSPVRLLRDGWFQPHAVAALRRGEDHASEFRRRRAGEKLWALLMLHLWSDAHPSVRFRW
jgi:asparagine synthase (glutamine-hydrolysing)